MIFRDKELYRATRNKKLGGVCAGVANYLELPGTWIRVAAVIGLLFTRPLLCWPTDLLYGPRGGAGDHEGL